MAAVKLYLDEDVRPLLAEILEGRGYDVASASSSRRRGLTDEEQLQVAIKERLGAGHGLVIEAPERLMAILNEFLANLTLEGRS